ncbi:hypothetical protein [Arthrobacter sp. H35-D1]|uniref:hypothetical protein n=1 Tax=Arthrobacter sp. H35-D1 TaxID=3046202 RepID=UPI0024B895C8|nr:hypothetical protein [Arthrobacter sp. H35-D1]MDJ0312505.1 hypothetical protein [Arthrobacter sp. H35-D1]
MSGAVWVMVAVGVFALIVVVLVTLLLIGRFSSKKPDASVEWPHPRPHDQAIPPNGSR